MKTTQISKKIDLIDLTQQRVIIINVDAVICKELLINFFLLREELVDSLHLKFNNSSVFFKMSKGGQPILTSFDHKKGLFKGILTIDSLEYIIYFLLKYYRDGFGEADHIDVDFKHPTEAECTITFKCDVYMEYTEEEMRKMLDG